jgi:hypothetical protein
MTTVRRFLQNIQSNGPSHTLETTDIGYLLKRRPEGDTLEFDRLARQAIDMAGDDFVALPRVDGAGYDQVIIIPFE